MCLHLHPKLCPMSRYAASRSLPSCLAMSRDGQLEVSLPREVKGFFQVIKQAAGAERTLVRRHDTQLCSLLKTQVANSFRRKYKKLMHKRGSRSSVLQTHPASPASKFRRCRETQA